MSAILPFSYVFVSASSTNSALFTISASGVVTVSSSDNEISFSIVSSDTSCSSTVSSEDSIAVFSEAKE